MYAIRSYYGYGGDEFVVLLPRADRLEALAVANHIVARVSAQPIIVDGERVRCGLSAGVASYDGGAETAEEVFRHADAALAQIKQSEKGHAA